MKFPRLNKSQLEKLSDIFSDLALISIASVVLPALLNKFSLLGSIIGISYLYYFLVR